MAEKALGYVELEWTCPSCNTRNPGPVRKCAQCGTAQPEETQFEQAAEEKILTDQAAIAAAEAGPDVYCAYCGARNPAAAPICKQCGAALSEGKARSAGAVVGALRDKPAPPQVCPACGAANPAAALKCAKCGAALGKAAPAQAAPAAARQTSGFRLLLLILLGVLALVVFFIVTGSRTRELVGQVADYGWRRTIAVQILAPVTRSGWRDELPADADPTNCRERVYRVQSEPAPGAREVCGTPYVVDTGSGYGQVKQDCQYEILADWCEYTVLAWVAGAPLVLEGRDFNPQWPALQLSQDQRAGGRSEEFVVVFRADDVRYTYHPRSIEEYTQFENGGAWVLEVNGFGDVTNVSPD